MFNLSKTDRDDLEALRRHQRERVLESALAASGGGTRGMDPPPDKPRSAVELMLSRALHNSSPGAMSTTSAQSTLSSMSSQESEQSAASCGGGVVPTVVMEKEMIKSENHSSGSGRRKRASNEDPMSHRIIEKRRRDRMNNCLADLSRLIPSSYLKKGRGRIEKTEIIEMAIKHMKHLQTHSNCRSIEKCDLLTSSGSSSSTSGATGSNSSSTVTKTEDGTTPPAPEATPPAGSSSTNATAAEMERNVESFRMGYHECLTETMHFLVEREDMYAGDALCVRIMTHMQKYFEKLTRVKSYQNQKTSSISSHGGDSSIHFPSTSAVASRGSGLHRNQAPSSHADSDYGSVGGAQLSSARLSEAPSSVRADSKDRYRSGTPDRTQQAESLTTHSDDGFRSVGSSPVKGKLSMRGMPSGRGRGSSSIKSAEESEEADERGAGEDFSGSKYKFKANMRNRFTHEEESCSSFASTAAHAGGATAAEGSSAGGPSSSSLEHPKKKARMAALSMSDTEMEKSQHGASGVHHDHPSNLNLLSMAASAVDARKHPSSVNTWGDEGASESGSRYSVPEAKPKLVEQAANEQPQVYPPHQSGHSVPIFALHPTRSYYLPLSIDYTLIAPYMLLSGLDVSSSSGGSPSGPTTTSSTSSTSSNQRSDATSSVILHPITINVNFCGPTVPVPASSGAPLRTARGVVASTGSSSQQGMRPGSSSSERRVSDTWRDRMEPTSSSTPRSRRDSAPGPEQPPR